MHADEWKAYYGRYEALKPRMQALMCRLAAPFGPPVVESNSDDAGFVFTVSRHTDGNRLDVELEMRDVGDFREGEAGTAGNLRFGMAEEGGLIVSSWVPHNYSERCWVSYAGAEEWSARLALIEEQEPDIAVAIQNWLEGQSE